jgi:hypothetical protein
MMNNIQNIVKEIDEKVNNDSLTSLRKETLGDAQSREYQTTKHSRIKKVKQKPSLVERLSNRLAKYKKHMISSTIEGYETKPSVGTGNNPLYNYPKIPPPLIYDPKYEKNKRKHTEFATTARLSGKSINLLETVGKYFSFYPSDRLYQFKKQNIEKLDAQRYLKYSEELRENRISHQKSLRTSKSSLQLPLHMRSELILSSHNHTLHVTYFHLTLSS